MKEGSKRGNVIQYMYWESIDKINSSMNWFALEDGEDFKFKKHGPSCLKNVPMPVFGNPILLRSTRERIFILFF